MAREGGGDAELEDVETKELDEVAITKNVVRSKRITSVALQAAASLSRCLVSTDAFGIRVCTIRDQAW